MIKFAHDFRRAFGGSLRVFAQTSISSQVNDQRLEGIFGFTKPTML